MIAVHSTLSSLCRAAMSLVCCAPSWSRSWDLAASLPEVAELPHAHAAKTSRNRIRILEYIKNGELEHILSSM